MLLKRVGVVVVAFGAVVWVGAEAPWDDGNDRWKLVADEGSVVFGEVVATGEREAWAFGWEKVGIKAWMPMADGPNRPTAFHWDGKDWAEQELPVERGEIGSVVAVSPSDVWALAGTDDGGTSALHWDGGAWTVARTFPADEGFFTLAAAGGDVWLLGDHTAWHYDGAAWSQREIPFDAFRASARAADDVWAIDITAAAVHRFDGKDWAAVDVADALPTEPPPADDAPPSPEGPRLDSITADASGVWITGEIGVSPFLLFQTDTGWRSEDISEKSGRMTHSEHPVADGVGGHWFLGSTDVNGYDSALAHRDAKGGWTKVPSGGELSSLSVFPGGPLFATGAIGGAGGVFRSLR
ncbi:hypothetical protein EDD29_8490 [Actinocorallia herbida]|uniref:Galactose oxidase-like protein n=1 Tax=Actinocorallia herbida TaxID=58109 RepID=A0A3N1DB50_9ACTN|nr:hypothetical protein [Actinocorallia herbida]ROO90752.1 hypothetical protein EDD29_8490 [Actinocorallia herbida]